MENCLLQNGHWVNILHVPFALHTGLFCVVNHYLPYYRLNSRRNYLQPLEQRNTTRTSGPKQWKSLLHIDTINWLALKLTCLHVSVEISNLTYTTFLRALLCLVIPMVKFRLDCLFLSSNILPSMRKSGKYILCCLPFCLAHSYCCFCTLESGIWMEQIFYVLTWSRTHDCETKTASKLLALLVTPALCWALAFLTSPRYSESQLSFTWAAWRST